MRKLNKKSGGRELMEMENSVVTVGVKVEVVESIEGIKGYVKNKIN